MGVLTYIKERVTKSSTETEKKTKQCKVPPKTENADSTLSEEKPVEENVRHWRPGCTDDMPCP